MLNKKGLLTIAKMEFKTEFDKIALSPNREDVKNESDFKKYEEDYRNGLMNYCPHCRVWFRNVGESNYQKSVTINIPTYSKEFHHYINMMIVTCHKCRKNFITVSMKTNEFDFEDEKVKFNPNSYYHGLIWNSKAHVYTDEELKQCATWEYIEKAINENK
jgi:hypothetical protein